MHLFNGLVYQEAEKDFPLTGLPKIVLLKVLILTRTGLVHLDMTCETVVSF